MTKNSLLKILGTGIIATSIILQPTFSYEKIFKYPLLINSYTSPSKERSPAKSGEYLKKKILKKKLNTGKYTPKQTVELLEKGIKNGGGLPEKMDITFIYSLIEKESEWNPKAKSSVGARGLGQIMKGTWEDYSPKRVYNDAYNPEKNLETVVKIINGHEEYFSTYHPNWSKLGKKEKLKIHIAAYNWGQRRIKDINFNLKNEKKIPLQTKNHIKRVMEIYERINNEKA
jgi:hypothetical protein